VARRLWCGCLLPAWLLTPETEPEWVSFSG
jgi:hypothetical protein